MQDWLRRSSHKIIWLSRFRFRVKERTKIDPEDAMLAGIAIQNNEPLLTRNKKDFAGIPQLKLETYWSEEPNQSE